MVDEFHKMKYNQIQPFFSNVLNFLITWQKRLASLFWPRYPYNFTIHEYTWMYCEKTFLSSPSIRSIDCFKQFSYSSRTSDNNIWSKWTCTLWPKGASNFHSQSVSASIPFGHIGDDNSLQFGPACKVGFVQP